MFGMSWEEKMDPGASLDPWLQGCKHWEEGHSHLPGCLGWDGKGPLGAGTFPLSWMFGMRWEEKMDPRPSLDPGSRGVNTGKRDPGASLDPGSGSVNTGIRDIPTFPDIWDGMGRGHWEQGHSHLPGCLGWDGKGPLGAGTFPPSWIFGMSWEGATGIREIPTFPNIWDELGRNHWKQGDSQFLDVWDGNAEDAPGGVGANPGKREIPTSWMFGMGWEGATGIRDIPNSWMFGMGWEGATGSRNIPNSWIFGMGWEGATGSRNIPTFPAVSFPTITWNIPLPGSSGTRNPRDPIPGLSHPLGATQPPPGMFIIPGKAAPGASFPLFPSRDRAPVPLGMWISRRYSGIFSLLGCFFPSKSWINPGFFGGMGSFHSSLVFWEGGITGKSFFPPLVQEYPEGIVASQRFRSTQILFFLSKSWINPGFFGGMGSFRSSFFFWEGGITGKSFFPPLVREYPEGIVASQILTSTRIPFSLGINSRFPSPSWIKTRIGIRQGLEFRPVTPLGSPSRPIPWKTSPPSSLIPAPEFPFPFPVFPRRKADYPVFQVLQFPESRDFPALGMVWRLLPFPLLLLGIWGGGFSWEFGGFFLPFSRIRADVWS
ncbi:PREDICTED: uncharacterized protein LOC108510091 isoform X8 [Lepidothrix coronata]|uniref:Uncharacterized protein LOC108510091 isoform X8 n=1 Tax=Lepidothrix coronata TaxID=321398 RepID=A0A6J0JAB6_9PASS|nr:PREDICTED: uncharacterized protein LOC108510091 isoform X8 [Lepidothrix coronata]